MSNTREQEHGLLLAQVEAIAAARKEGAERDQLIGFIRSYFESVPDDVLGALHPPELFAIAAGHFAFIRQREGAQAHVRVYQATAEEHGWASDACMLETVAPDCPFLVDSIAMAIRNAGGVIRWLVHPVLATRRDANGVLQTVTSPSPGAQSLESLIHVQFDGVFERSDLELLEQRVSKVLTDLRLVVTDYPQMRERLHDLVGSLAKPPPGMDPDDIAEVAAFLRWLDDDHFTFLAYGESRVLGEGNEAHFEYLPESGLGLSRGRDDDGQVVAPASELDKYAASRRPLIVTKASTRSQIHHDEYLDSVSVKRFDASGAVLGTCRFVGLFSNEVYNSLPRQIPSVRRKISWVMANARVRPGSHAGKQLQQILDGLPTDELFQSSEQELLELASGVRSLRETQRLRLFMRRDRYGRFFSCLVYLQRDQYSKEGRERMGRLLVELLDGTDVEQQVEIQRDGLARVHFIVRTAPGSKSPLKIHELELRLQEATRSWDDALRDYLGKILRDADARQLTARFRGAFGASYREQAAPVEAATDLQYLHRLSPAEPLLVRLMEAQDQVCDLRLKLYVHAKPASLSAVLPTLEHFGLQVQAQHPYEVTPATGGALWIQEFELHQTGVCILTSERMRTLFEDAFGRTIRGEVEDDGINSLVLTAGLDWRQAALLRTICKYLLQTAWPYSQNYIEDILSQHATIASDLVRLFEARFDPQFDAASRDGQIESLTARLNQSLDAISSLDVDRVLRAFISVVTACLRTNFYQRDPQGQPKPYISLKLDPAGIDELPLPKPMFEAFVYSPDVEGIHLRGGKVARGGLRWSDRRQDFRTEVLGLVKAQMVKNAVIVPVGAKGGFVVKRSLAGLDREAFMAAGIECYKTFIRGLLDITDNLVDGSIVPPPEVLRRDDDDPYLVVAADKGTASFSDIANSVSAEYGFWLGDAFASGGSVGYDHKKMGITARSAWESVKRHFREIDIDCQAQDFTCVGVGDMAGDVFGNGMLLSPHTRLVAAFNHLHIFIDPNPDAAASFAERKRLFELPRSSWADYKSELISEGGGVYERSAKQIELSPQARKALGIEQARLTPTALLHEILKAPVDLLWNGGIGTYVKSRQESHQDVGDRANDALRIDGRELRCKIVGEGGNLGMTQLGRVEFALHGGRVITDFNDNAGGVNSSDREVNIKIPLNKLLDEQSLALEDRNRLLESMTADVASGVLRDSYQQTQALGLMQQQAVGRLDEHADFMRMLEKDGLLNRAIEFLPDDERVSERRAERQGLTLPEQAVLLSYGKISLYQSVLGSGLPDDPYLEKDLLTYFPPALRDSQPAALKAHYLRREIVATVITNQTVNRMGVTFAHRTALDRGLSRDKPVLVYLAAREIFQAEERFAAIEACDGKLPILVQYLLMERVSGLLKHVSSWFLRNVPGVDSLSALIERFAEPAQVLESSLDEVLPAAYQQQRQRYAQDMQQMGVSDDIASAYANHHVIGSALDVAMLGESSGYAVGQVARVYFELGERLRLPWLLSEINRLRVEGRWQALARNNMREEAYSLHRLVVSRALQSEGDTAQQRMQNWLSENAAQLEFAELRLHELETLSNNEFASLTIALGELQRLSL